MSTQLKNGDRVAIHHVGTEETPLPRGLFISRILDTEDAVVLVNDGWSDEGWLDRIPLSEIIPENEAEEVERLIQAQTSQLEQEYEAVREQIAGQMQIATTALQEAARLAGKHSLKDFYDEVQPFIRLLQNDGWRASTMNC